MTVNGGLLERDDVTDATAGLAGAAGTSRDVVSRGRGNAADSQANQTQYRASGAQHGRECPERHGRRMVFAGNHLSAWRGERS
jgi:hypothetical protein